MTTILPIDSSSRPAGLTTDGHSFTREITDHLVGWLMASALAGPSAPATCAGLTPSRPALADWMHRFRAVPGVADTYPPHWRT